MGKGASLLRRRCAPASGVRGHQTHAGVADCRPLSPTELPRSSCRLTDERAVPLGSLHEDGVHFAGRHVMRRRPSLFNYGTAQDAVVPRRLKV